MRPPLSFAAGTAAPINFNGLVRLIYLLVVAQFRSYLVPLIIMAPIPLTLVVIPVLYYASMHERVHTLRG